VTELEKVEKLREKANVTFAEAKAALDNCGGDILDSLIYLENQGKVTAPAGGGYYSGANMPPQPENVNYGNYNNNTDNSDSTGEEFTDLLKRFGAFCLKMFNKGVSNHLVATKGDQHLFSCPVIVVVVLAIFFFWATIPLFVISLFCGFRYRFTGDDLGKDSVNSVMNSATNVVDDVKKSFTESAGKSDNSD